MKLQIIRKALVKFMATILVSSSLLVCFQYKTSVYADTTATVVNVTSYLNIRSEASTSGTILGKLYAGNQVTILDTSDSSWYKIQFGSIVGYCSSAYLSIDSEEEPGPADEEFETAIANFPDSYKTGLRSLHAKHPDWTFTYMDAGDWSTALSLEEASGVSLVPLSSDRSFLDMNDKGVVDSPDWVNASDEIIAYYLDPRNMLTEAMAFQFMDLNCPSDTSMFTEDALSAAMSGTFMDDSSLDYTINGTDSLSPAAAFVEAGTTSGVNPFFLLTHIIQECGTNGSVSSDGSTGFYNMYNIGAYSDVTNAAVLGLDFAENGINETFNATYNIPWNTAGKSIVYGGKWIYDYYVGAGQTSLYLMRFNVAPTDPDARGKHQYMTALQSCASESQRLYDIYSSSGNIDTAINFLIPVYSDMPSSASPMPTPLGITGYTDVYNEGSWVTYNNKWCFKDENGAYVYSAWVNTNSRWYFIDDEGYMVTGWRQIDCKWYYMDGSGMMTTGWQFVNNKWYYMNSSGAMATGWKKVNGKWYYLSSSGAMVTGWQKVGEKWYYMNGTGAMETGWQFIGGKWYYLSASGAMLTGWQKINGTWYYMYESGAMASNTTIGSYYVNSDGAWVPN